MDDYKSFFDNGVEGMFRTSPEGRYLLINKRLANIYGFSSPKVMAQYFHDIGRQLYVATNRRNDFVKLISENDEIKGFESLIKRKDGSLIWISENARTVRDYNGKIIHFEGTVIDITEQKRLQNELAKKEEIYLQLFTNSPLAMILAGSNGEAQTMNESFRSLFGYSNEDIIKENFRACLVPEDLFAESQNYRAALLSGHRSARETIRRHKEGRLIPVLMQGLPVMGQKGPVGIFYIFQDISERKEFEKTISHQAFHDFLTDLPNRNLFSDRLSLAIHRAKRNKNYNFALVLMDLDKFKRINDTLGHQTGDQVLIRVAEILSNTLRNVDTAARLGGDEFALILDDSKSEQEIVSVLKRIQKKLRKPMIFGDLPITIGASMGIVIFQSTYANSTDMLRDADIAMYRAKELGRMYEFFTTKMQEEIMQNLRLESFLRQAIDKKQLYLEYQPIVSLDGSTVSGFEALVRWHHPELGLIPPSRFIPIAEECGLIVAIGNWVLEESCHQLSQWMRENDFAERLIISVNVSIQQFIRSNLINDVISATSRHFIRPEQIRLEITESMLMQEKELVIHTLRQLRSVGFQIAIDDFGTGYSSLSYLRDLPVDCLKIDRSFLNRKDSNKESSHIIESVVSLAQKLGMSVVAEGVETNEQKKILTNACVDHAQGFLYARPMPHNEAFTWIRPKTMIN